MLADRCAAFCRTRLGVVLVVALLTLWSPLWSGTALAHDVVERTLPADGTTADVMPAVVTITMTEDPVPVGTQVVVTGPSGPVSDGVPTVQGRTVTQKIAANAPGGDYSVAYRITSSDGHPVSGTFRFHARVGRDGSTATASAAPVQPSREDPDVTEAKSSQLVPVVLSVAGTAILAMLAAVLWQVSKRRSR